MLFQSHRTDVLLVIVHFPLLTESRKEGMELFGREHVDILATQLALHLTHCFAPIVPTCMQDKLKRINKSSQESENVSIVQFLACHKTDKSIILYFKMIDGSHPIQDRHLLTPFPHFVDSHFIVVIHPPPARRPIAQLLVIIAIVAVIIVGCWKR